MLQTIKLWFSTLLALILHRWLPSTEKEEKTPNLLRLNLQYFADPGDEDEGDDEEEQEEDEDESEEDEDEEPNLEQMLKDNPALKKQFNALFKDKFNKRLKGVDLKKAKALLAQQDKKDSKTDTKEDDETDKVSQLELNLERKTKRMAVKEYAVDNGYNPKLVARLVDLDKLELNEDGEVDPEDLEDAFEELADEFPEMFAQQDDEDEDEDEEESTTRKKTKKSSYRPGSKQKGNKKPNKNAYELGRQRALARHKKG